MRATGKCPKCQSSEIYTDDSMTKRGQRTSIGISTWSSITISAYACMSCGFYEEYIDYQDLNDQRKIEKLKSGWKRHEI